MSISRRFPRRLVPALTTAVAVLTISLSSASAATNSATALSWFDESRQTIAAAAYPEPVTASRAWAISWLAATRAAERTQGPAYQEAAFASALHDALASLVPARQSALDQELTSTLDGVPDRPRKTAAVQAGHIEAAAALAERAGDGLDAASVDTPWSPPPAGAGIWQPTPPSYGPAVRAGQRFGKPFLIESASQFRPGPPPALDSARYLNALAEVHAVGAVGSSVRTPEQTDVARWWAQNSIDAYTQLLRGAIAQGHWPLVRDARLVAGFHAITTDAQIAIYEAKYTYDFWRPVTAIRTGSVDPDPSWTPFTNTPRHPEYPSGHAGYAGAAEVALSALAGPRPIEPLTATSSTAPGVTETYGSWHAPTQQTIDARVWEGVHFRFSDEVGADVGRQVAEFDVDRLNSLGI